MPKFNARRGVAAVKRDIKPLAKRSVKMTVKLAPYAIGGGSLKGAVSGAKFIKTTAGRNATKKAIGKGVSATKRGYAAAKDRIEKSIVQKQQRRNARAYAKKYGR